jgi:hypothetical protein
VRFVTNKRLYGALSIIVGLLVVFSTTSTLVYHENFSETMPMTDKCSSHSGSLNDSFNDTQVYTELPGPEASFGTYLYHGGDITGDGCDDILQWRLHFSRLHYMVPGSHEREFLPRDIIKYDGLRWILPVGDINGDGFDDVVCSSEDELWNPYSNKVSSLPTRIQVRYGTAEGLPHDDDAFLYIKPVESNGSTWGLLTYVKAGDVNGDGFSDLLVLAGAGTIKSPYTQLVRPVEIQLYYGSKDGLGPAPGWTADLTNDTINWTGIGIISTADFNGDGCSDVIIGCGAKYPDSNISSYQAFRFVSIHYGSRNGISLIPNMMIPGNSTEGYLNHVGTIRYNNDTLSDLTTSFLLKGSTPPDDEISRFVVHVGTRNGISEDEAYSITSNLTWLNMWFLSHYRILFLDLNGDGRDDAVSWYSDRINKTSEEPGRPDWEYIPHMNIHLRIFFNDNGRYPVEPDVEYSLWNITYSYPRLFGGDYDGDGNEDLAISCGGGYIGKPPYPQGVWFNGRLFIFFGSGLTSLKDPFFHVGGATLYAGYQAYDFMIRDNPRRFGSSRKVILTLDPGSADVLLEWQGNASTSKWSVPRGSELVSLTSTHPDVILDDEGRMAWFRFEIEFDWDWPHERPCDVRVEYYNETGLTYTYEREDVFSVENDLDLTGKMRIVGETQGELEPGGWVSGGEELSVHGLEVVYEGTVNVHPPARTCLVKVADNDGDNRVQSIEPDGVVEFMITADNKSDIHESLTVRLLDLPGKAQAISNRTFDLRVDADPPRFESSIPDSDDWHSTDRVLVSIIANDTGTSGVDKDTLEYSFLGASGIHGWTRDGLSLDGDGPTIEATAVLQLPDGIGYWVRWRVMDRVGNPYSVSDRIPIRVDTRNVTFTNPFPHDDEWRNSTDVTCGVTIRDLEGSGIDVKTIEYRFSTQNVSNYGEWILLDSGQEDSRLITVQVPLVLSDGPYNYIQWRAADIAGNGLTVSAHFRIQVDTTPVIFVSFWPADILNSNETLARVLVDVGKFNLDDRISLGSYRIRLGGETYSTWITTEIEIDGPFIRLQAHLGGLVEGVENYVQFYVFDSIRNAPVYSPEYQLRVDTRGPEFISMLPVEESIQPERLVTVQVRLTDMLAGVDQSRVYYRFSMGADLLFGSWHSLPVILEDGTYVGSVDIYFSLGPDNVIQFIAKDILGNEAKSVPLHVWVNRPPHGVIGGIVNGGNYSVGERVNLTADGSSDPDGHNLSFEWYLDESLIDIDSEMVINDLLTVGDHTITLIVTDSLGAKDSVSEDIAVEPEVIILHDETEPFPTGLIIILIVIAVTVSTYLYLRHWDRIRHKDEI